MLSRAVTSRAIVGARPLLYTTPIRFASSFKLVETSEEEVIKNRKERPTSPHLTIYKFPLPAIMSITHRGTGIVLTAAFAAAGIGMLGASHELVYYMSALQSTGILLPVIKFSLGFPFVYHSLAGTRHMIWDANPTDHLQLEKVHKTGVVIIGASVLIAGALAFLTF